MRNFFVLDWRFGLSNNAFLTRKLMVTQPRSALKLRLIFLAVLLTLIGSVQAVTAQNVGIARPASGETIGGVVLVEGNASDANFLRYELAFLQDANPGAGWIVFADGDQPVFNGTLAVWDTTVGQNVNAPVFPDGSYQLRLRIVRADYNYDEYFVTGVFIQNGNVAAPPTETPLPLPTEPPTPLPEQIAPTEPAPPPTESAAPPTVPPEVTEVPPTPTIEPTPPPTATPLLERVVPTLVPTLEVSPPPEQIEVLPSLTPFPTPTRQPTVESQSFNPIFREQTEGGEGDDSPGLIEGLLNVDFEFGSAFGNGMRAALYLFVAFGVYLLVRGFLRWVWRTISSNW